MIYRLALLAFSLALPNAHAEVLFEGFYRIEKSGKHVGYAIQRLSRDSRSATKTLVTYVMQHRDGHDIYEVVKSIASDKNLSPIETRYFGNKLSKDYLTVFGSSEARVEIRDPITKKVSAVERFASNRAPVQSGFLFQTTNIPKLETGKRYYFKMYGEYQSRPAFGELILGEVQKAGGLDIKQLVSITFGELIENFVSDDGFPIASRAPAQNQVAYWVKDRSLAFGSFEYPSKSLVSTFGDLPEGKKNPWYQIADFDALKAIQNFKNKQDTRDLAGLNKRRTSYPMPTRVR